MLKLQRGDRVELTLRNLSGERHVFRIHQIDFLVKSINHQDIDETGLRDVADIPYQQDGVPGEVKVIIPFTDPNMVGRFVFHCHIVEHEDKGMMANVVVLPPEGVAMAPARMRTVAAKPPERPWQTLLASAGNLIGLGATRRPPDTWFFDDAICRGSNTTARTLDLPRLLR